MQIMRWNLSERQLQRSLGCVSPLLVASGCVLAVAMQLDGVMDSEGCLDLLLRNTSPPRLLVALLFLVALFAKRCAHPRGPKS